MISNKKTSVFITHFSLKVQSGKKLFCLLDQHITPGRLQYTRYRVQGWCAPLCRCTLSEVGERSTFHALIRKLGKNATAKADTLKEEY